MSDGPKDYIRRPDRVQAMRYTAETCRELHEWLDVAHQHDRASCGKVPIAFGLSVFAPGEHVTVDGSGALPRAYTDAEFRARYVAAGEGGALLWDRRIGTAALNDWVNGGCVGDPVAAIESALPAAVAGLTLTDEERARCRYWLEHFTGDEAGQPLRAAEQADIAAVLRAYLAGQEGA